MEEIVKSLESIEPSLEKSLEQLRQTNDCRVKDIIKDELVRPFLEALGHARPNLKVSYDAGSVGVGTGNSNRVDYAILCEDVPRVFVVVCHLCESIESRFDKLAQMHAMVSSVEVSVLTNGNEYRLYSSKSTDDHCLSEKPFLQFELSELGWLKSEIVRMISKPGIEAWCAHGGLTDVLQRRRESESINEVINSLFSKTPSIDDEFIKYILDRAGIVITARRTAVQERAKYEDRICDAIKSRVFGLVMEGKLSKSRRDALDDGDFIDDELDDDAFNFGIDDDDDASEGEDSHRFLHDRANPEEQLMSKMNEILQEIDNSLVNSSALDIDNHCFDLTFNNVEDASFVDPDACYFDGQQIEIVTRRSRATMKDVFLSVIKYLESRKPGTLLYLERERWSNRGNSSNPLVIMSPNILQEDAYTEFCGVYIYTRQSTLAMMRVLEKVIEEYGFDPSTLRIVVHRNNKQR